MSVEYYLLGISPASVLPLFMFGSKNKFFVELAGHIETVSQLVCGFEVLFCIFMALFDKTLSELVCGFEVLC
jgi:hypothetical protein